ncbi:MAG: hypothetical protein MHM6MM_005972, partial [Cercozoa sp. M6MM]
QYRAIGDFPGNGIDECSFETGDVLLMNQPADGGWFQGTNKRTGSKGFVPLTYVEKIVEPVRKKAPPRTVQAPAQSVQAPARSVQAPARSVQAPARSVQAPARSVQAPPRQFGAARSVQAPPRAAVQAPPRAAVQVFTPPPTRPLYPSSGGRHRHARMCRRRRGSSARVRIQWHRGPTLWQHRGLTL